MSTLKVTNIQDTSGGNSSTTEQIKNGIAKAWVNFNGTGTVAIRASYNVSSITDNGTGDYTVNFATAMVDANYSTSVTPQATAANTGLFGCMRHSVAPTSSAVRVSVNAVDAGFRDTDYVNVAIFR
jgi:hypothetical protein